MSTQQQVDPNLHDINLHVKPGRERAPFFRYIRINLPRLTRAAIVAIMAVQAVLAFVIAQTDFHIFDGQRAALYVLGAAAAIFVLAGLVPSTRPWDFGLVPAVGSIVLFLAALGGTPPWVWNGADVYLAAGWNTIAYCGVAYLVLYWALGYGVLAAYPDDQGFED